MTGNWKGLAMIMTADCAVATYDLMQKKIEHPLT
jgi:hypothetical protein